MAGLKSFKGALSQLYGEQRAQVKGIKERSLVNKAKNEAKRELEEAQSDQPVHFLRIDGRAARLVKNDAQFYAQQQNEGLVPWGAQPDVLIDRYDVRSLLDMYVAPDPRVLAHRQRTAKELELDEQLRFEAYRDLVRLKCLGLSERQGIAHAEQENVAIRAASRAAAVAALEAAKGPKPLPSQSSLFAGSGANAIPAGTGQFAAVGFSYGGSEGGGGGGEDDDDDEEEEESDDDDVPATAEDADMDRSALKEFGLEDFSSMLRWAMREEAEEAAAVRRRKRYTGWGRKKASIRAKRLVGQGLNPTEFAKRPPAHYGGAAALQPNDISWIPERKTEDLAQMFDRRASPEYDGEGGRRRSRSPSSRRPQAEYITSFGGAADQAPGHGQGPRQQQRHEEGPSVRDALPGAADPALEGPHMLPAAAIKLHGVRPEERGRDRYGSISGRDYSKAKSAAAAPKVVKAVDKSKETPQERLKRLMAAQLNKKIQSDTITAAQKKQQEDAERRARMANEAAAQEAERRDRERERARRRSRSRSPRSDRRRSDRSRSRERERERDSRRRSRSRSRSRDRQHRRRSPSPYRGYRR